MILKAETLHGYCGFCKTFYWISSKQYFFLPSRYSALAFHKQDLTLSSAALTKLMKHCRLFFFFFSCFSSQIFSFLLASFIGPVLWSYRFWVQFFLLWKGLCIHYCVTFCFELNWIKSRDKLWIPNTICIVDFGHCSFMKNCCRAHTQNNIRTHLGTWHTIMLLLYVSFNEYCSIQCN